MKKYLASALIVALSVASLFAADLPRVDKPVYWNQAGLKDLTILLQKNLEAIQAATVAIESAGIVDGTIVNADVNGSAAIARAKLALTGTLVNADVATNAAIARTKLALTGTLVDADVATNAAIARTKLSLGGVATNFSFLLSSGATCIVYTVDGVVTNFSVP